MLGHHGWDKDLLLCTRLSVGIRRLECITVPNVCFQNVGMLQLSFAKLLLISEC